MDVAFRVLPQILQKQGGIGGGPVEIGVEGVVVEHQADGVVPACEAGGHLFYIGHGGVDFVHCLGELQLGEFPGDGLYVCPYAVHPLAQPGEVFPGKGLQVCGGYGEVLAGLAQFFHGGGDVLVGQESVDLRQDGVYLGQEVADLGQHIVGHVVHQSAFGPAGDRVALGVVFIDAAGEDDIHVHSSQHLGAEFAVAALGDAHLVVELDFDDDVARVFVVVVDGAYKAYPETVGKDGARLGEAEDIVELDIKEMGGLDIGQSVVMKDRMIMAIEAIEGTDKCIERGCKLGGKGITVVKVSKPTQDKRFDIPAIGLNTLKTMNKFGAKILAIEANETIIVDQKKVIDYANKKGIIVMAI